MAEYNNKNRCFYFEKAALVIMVITALIIISLVMFTDLFSGSGKKTDDRETTVPTPRYLNYSKTEAETTLSETPVTTTPTQQTKIEYKTVSVNNDKLGAGSLILVNNNYPFTIPEGFESTLIEYHKTYPEKDYGFGYMHRGEDKLLENSAKALNEMLSGFKKATGKTDIIVDRCYIDYETIRSEYEKQVKKLGEQEASTWVKKAGCSEHHTGLAFDLYVSPKSGKIGEGTYKWLTEHCAEYGIIHRFPDEKQNITFEKNEPDHFRYVGIPHAAYIMNEGICLEEYMALVRDHKYDSPLEVSAGEDTYYVFFAPADISKAETEIKVPVDADPEISGNNVDGFIVSWKS